MSQVDEDTLELIERRLADRVTERVRGRLFKFYGGIAAAVLAAMSYAGWDLVETTKTNALSIAEATSKTIIAEKVDPIAERAGAVLQEAEIQLKVLAELQRQARSAMFELDRNLANFEPKAQALEGLITKVDDIDGRRKAIEASLQDAQDTTQSFGEVTQKLAALATQVEVLGGIVGKLSDGPRANPTSPPDDVTAYDVAKEAKKVAAAAYRVTKQVKEVGARTTVFLQYWGIDRQQAKSISNELRNRGYSIPGEDEERMPATGLLEVRFFHRTDEAKAEALARDSENVIATLGEFEVPVKMPVDVTVRDYTAWTKLKPRPGIVELWIGLPTARAM